MAQPDVAASRPKRGIRGLARQADPAFAAGAVAVPVFALAAALTTADLRWLLYVHLMTGVLVSISSWD